MTSKSLRMIFNMLLGVALGCGLTVVMLVYGDELEGRFFPVMSPLQIGHNIGGDAAETFTTWTGSAHRLRACNYLRTEWFLGPRSGRRVEVKVSYLDPPKVRKKGFHEWSGIVVYLDETSVLENSHADVIHKCPWRFWETRTRFYDSKRN